MIPPFSCKDGPAQQATVGPPFKVCMAIRWKDCREILSEERKGRGEVWVNKADIRRGLSQKEEWRGRTGDNKQRRRQEKGGDVAWYHRDTETSQTPSAAAAAAEEEDGGRKREAGVEGLDQN